MKEQTFILTMTIDVSTKNGMDAGDVEELISQAIRRDKECDSLDCGIDDVMELD